MTFNQENEVTIGNYEYFLNKVNDHDWYLQSSYLPTPDPSEPTFRKEIAGYQISPWLNANYAFETAGTWHQRQGAQHDGGHMWARTKGLHTALGSGRYGYSTNTFFLQLGGDLWQNNLPGGVTKTAGIMATVGRFNSNTSDCARLSRPGLSAYAGKLNTQAWSLAGYYTVTNSQGAWLDTVVQQTFYRTHLQSLGNTNQNSTSSLLSLEGGFSIKLTHQWQLEPQLQLMSQWLRSGTSSGQDLRIDSTGQMLGMTRAGLRLSYISEKLKPYLQFDVIQHIGEVKRAYMDELKVNPDLELRWWKASAGIDGQLTRNTSIYAETEYQHSFKRGVEGYSGNLGLKYRF